MGLFNKLFNNKKPSNNKTTNGQTDKPGKIPVENEETLDYEIIFTDYIPDNGYRTKMTKESGYLYYIGDTKRRDDGTIIVDEEKTKVFRIRKKYDASGELMKDDIQLSRDGCITDASFQSGEACNHIYFKPEKDYVYFLDNNNFVSRIKNDLIHPSNSQSEIASITSLKHVSQHLTDKYDEQTANRIMNNEIWLEMAIDMLQDSWGEPSEKKESVSKEKHSEKWYFQPRTTQQNTVVYKKEVKIENGLVVSWKDLE
tara:strand:- start:1184 stop:1951 length:768 start_codon:yes stop_codon:yes gene_type:complete